MDSSKETWTIVCQNNSTDSSTNTQEYTNLDQVIKEIGLIWELDKVFERRTNIKHFKKVVSARLLVQVKAHRFISRQICVSNQHACVMVYPPLRQETGFRQIDWSDRLTFLQNLPITRQTKESDANLNWKDFPHLQKPKPQAICCQATAGGERMEKARAAAIPKQIRRSAVKLKTVNVSI